MLKQFRKDKDSKKNNIIPLQRLLFFYGVNILADFLRFLTRFPLRFFAKLNNKARLRLKYDQISQKLLEENMFLRKNHDTKVIILVDYPSL